ELDPFIFTGFNLINMNNINYKGAIFDMDGTLLDSMYLWDINCNKYLTDRNIEPEPNLAQVFKEKTLTESAAYYQQRYKITDSIEKICDDINNMIEYSYTHDVEKKPGVIAFLEHLKKNNVKMYVCSATDSGLMKKALKFAGILDYFEGVISTQDTGISKREPDVYDRATSAMGLTRKDVHIFEDSYYAIETCYKAGYHVSAMADRSSFEDADNIKKIVDNYVSSFEELI
ncbi:MAG: HAD family phosphatase, partial [Lachnospiraceae bacterium]|nr:HAD family phosphatase [Lachnospiraceae bacterium]